MKSEGVNDFQDNFVRQTSVKDPSISFSRTNDSPVQWIQLLQALDQQDLLGWPLITPFKVQMQKCEKCSREFCSPINYRRHIRVHRRSLNVDKESHKNRDFLGAFWDKISLDEAKDIVSFKDVILEGVPGSLVVKSLASFICSPGFGAFPHAYVKAGSALLDIVQATPSGLPISSQDLFSILDAASERTFLCAGNAESMQKYVFDGDAGKIGLEMKNLIACTSFLFEKKLIKAWIANKDAEALRCQKLLVEEEEAVRRRQTELLERRRQKKIRQKEQKTKVQAYEEKPDLNRTASLSERAESDDLCIGQFVSEGDLHALEALEDQVPSLLEPVHFLNNEEASYIEPHGGISSENLDSGGAQIVESRKGQGNGHRDLVNKWQVPKSQNGGWNGFRLSQSLHMVKPEPVKRYATNRDQRVVPISGSKVWTKKTNRENCGKCVITKVQEEDISQTTNCEVMIGSVPVIMRNVASQGQGNSQTSQDTCSSIEHVATKNISAQDKLTKLDSVQTGSNRSTVKFWRPVSRNDSRGQFAVQSGNQESEDDTIPDMGGDRNIPGRSCLRLGGGNGNNSNIEEVVLPKVLSFSSHAARAFLAQRWNEAISGDHVTLILSPEPKSLGSDCTQDDCSAAESADKAPDIAERSILGSAENWLAGIRALQPSTNGHAKAKFRKKPEKGVKIKYIPKQRNAT